MAIFSKLKALAAALLLAASMQAAFSDIVSIGKNPSIVAIDLPEGYILANADSGGSSYQLQSTILPVSLIVKNYGKDVFPGAKEAVEDNLSRIKAKGDIKSVKWRSQDAALAEISFSLGNSTAKGYAAAAVLPEDEGTVFLLAWSGEEKFAQCEPFILSTIDGLCIDYGSYFSPGLASSFLYPATEQLVPLTLDIAGNRIQTALTSHDKEAAEYLIEREYKVLTLYANNGAWREAWQRYYRMIFKDSCGRMKRPAFDIYNALAPSCTDETDLAQALLRWMQECSYEREKNSSDFASLPSMLLGGGSDCDARSMMLAVLLRAMNMDSCIFVSATFSHALAGFVSSHPGHSFAADGKNYLMGETTAKDLTWGKIPAEMDDQSQWISVIFPY